MKNNEEIIRQLYSLAEGQTKNTVGFVSMFAQDGYFFDVPAGKTYCGAEIGPAGS